MAEDDEAPDVLKLAILAVLAGADRPLSAEEVVERLALAVLEAGVLPPGAVKGRGH